MATKFKGKNLSLTVDGTEFSADGTEVVLDNEEADDDAITFADLENGDAVDWFFAITAVSDYGAGSFWDLLWENAGADAVDFVFKPYGNAVASATQPHFTGTCTIPKKPPVGGTAGETWTYEARLDVEGEPEKVITGP
jgi:hypothetical protein